PAMNSRSIPTTRIQTSPVGGRPKEVSTRFGARTSAAPRTRMYQPKAKTVFAGSLTTDSGNGEKGTLPICQKGRIPICSRRPLDVKRGRATGQPGDRAAGRLRAAQGLRGSKSAGDLAGTPSSSRPTSAPPPLRGPAPPPELGWRPRGHHFIVPADLRASAPAPPGAVSPPSRRAAEPPSPSASGDVPSPGNRRPGGRMTHPESVAERFYAAFARRDPAGMAAC